MSVKLASLVTSQKNLPCLNGVVTLYIYIPQDLNSSFSYTPPGFCLDPWVCPLQLAFSMQHLVIVPCHIVKFPFILAVNQFVTLLDDMAYTCSLGRRSKQW